MSKKPEAGAQPNEGIQRSPWMQFSVHSLRQGAWAGPRSGRATKATLRMLFIPRAMRGNWRDSVCGLGASCSVRADWEEARRGPGRSITLTTFWVRDDGSPAKGGGCRHERRDLREGRGHAWAWVGRVWREEEGALKNKP